MKHQDLALDTGWLSPASLARYGRGDLSASLVIFLLGLPLAMGVALTAGAPIYAGFISTIVGGLLVGGLGRVPAQVSGPAVSLTLLIAAVCQQYGFAAVGAVTMLAGLLQIALSLLRCARFMQFTPKVVITGMMAGVGASIALAQAYVMLGASAPGSALVRLVSLPMAFAGASRTNLAVAGLTMGVALIWERLPIGKYLPGSVMGIVAGTWLQWYCGWQLPTVQLPSGLFHMQTAGFGLMSPLALLWSSISLALLASLYTLISALSVQPVLAKDPSRLDAELRVQGLGNLAAGFLGGLPMAGVVPRTAANVLAGARTNLSVFIHGIWLLLAYYFGRDVLSLIPLPALAAVFVSVGLRLLSVKQLTAAHRDRVLLPFLATFFGVLGLNMLGGAILGCAVYWLAQRSPAWLDAFAKER